MTTAFAITAPPVTYLSGSIRMKSNIHLAKFDDAPDAVIRNSPVLKR